MSKICYVLSPHGFCSGIIRAVNMLEQVLKLYGEVYIIEDIIHNKIFMEQFKSKGVFKVDSIDDVPDGSVVMFSAHGVSPAIIEIAEKKGLTIIEGTCPIVKSIQLKAKEASEKEKSVVIIGNMAHQEIISLWGCVNSKNSYVVFNEMDIELLPDLSNKEIEFFTQTTLDPNLVHPVVEILKKKFPNINIEKNDDICYATKERQSAVRKAATSVDLMIVLGSAHSSNAKRLQEVAMSSGLKNVIRIDSKDEINLKIFEDISSFAITASASTPEFIFDDLLKYLQESITDLEIQKYEMTTVKDF